MYMLAVMTIRKQNRVKALTEKVKISVYFNLKHYRNEKAASLNCCLIKSSARLFKISRLPCPPA